MPRTVHPPEWPDKVVFAAMLVVIAGAMGALFALMRLGGMTVDTGLSNRIEVLGPAYSLTLCIVTAALGAYGIHHQASVWVWLGIATGVVSFGMLGLVPLLCLVAIFFLRRSRAEGEETVHDARRFAPPVWPDKALAASLLLFVGGAIALLQAFLVAQDGVLLPLLVRDVPTIVAGVSAATGLWSLYASFEVYRLRRPWTGTVAAILNVAAFTFLILGPALGLAALLLIRKAHEEDEFVEVAAA